MMGWLLVGGIVVLLLAELFGFWAMVGASLLILLIVYGFEFFGRDKREREEW